MHVVMVNKVYPPIMAGGAELIVQFLCEELASRGHRVTSVSTCGPEMEPYAVETRNGVECIRFFPKNLYWNFARGLAPKATTPPSAMEKMQDRARTARWHVADAWNRDTGRRIADIIERGKPDIMHTHLLDGLSATVWHEAKRAGLPVIHTAHDYHLLCPRAFMLSRSWKICSNPTLVCRAYRNWHIRTSAEVDLFTSPSQFLLDLHLQAGLRSRENAVVVNGIPLSRFNKPQRQRPRNHFLMISRLTQEKGVRLVLDAFARLPPDEPAELAIIGRGPLEAEVRAAAERDPRIRSLGFVDEATKLGTLDWAHHMILPSMWYENAPSVILEAAAAGLTLIGSRIGGIPEFVREGKTGVLVPPGDVDALTEAMRQVIHDEGMAQNLDAETASLVAAHSVPRMADAFTERYERLMAEKR